MAAAATGGASQRSGPSSVVGGSLERLRVLEHCHDGFEIAEQDLRLRGAGEVFGTGTRQSGGLDASDLCQVMMTAWGEWG